MSVSEIAKTAWKCSINTRFSIVEQKLDESGTHSDVSYAAIVQVRKHWDSLPWTESLILSPEALIERMIEHIPDKHFKMIRYFGFLSNRRRGEMLPKVYDALGIAPKDAPEMPGYAAMLKGYVKVDPFECILCGHRLTFLGFRVGERLCFRTQPTLSFDAIWRLGSSRAYQAG